MGEPRLLLPWITLSFLFSAQYARLTRAGMLETMSEDYIRTARAKGSQSRRSSSSTLCGGSHPGRHDLRPRLRPATRGAVLTEKTFSLNGLGKYGYDAIVQGDLPKILGVTLVAGFFS